MSRRKKETVMERLFRIGREGEARLDRRPKCPLDLRDPNMRAAYDLGYQDAMRDANDLAAGRPTRGWRSDGLDR